MPELVRAVCVLLIKGEKTQPCYFKWYVRGVENGLRITGLYEYYMASMEEPDIQNMPQVIRMYFAYDTSLDYRRRAAIYRRITENRDSDAQTYRNYRAAIEKFTFDQLEAGRINDDLIVLYRAFLRKSMLTAKTAKKLSRILCSYEVLCPAADAGWRHLFVRSDLFLKNRRCLNGVRRPRLIFRGLCCVCAFSA